MAALLERAQVFYIEGVAWFESAGAARSGEARGTTQSWLQENAGRSPRQAAGDRRVARLLHGDEERPLLATNFALESGQITLEQARLIAAAMHPLDPETVDRIEAALVQAVIEASPAATEQLCAHAAELATPAGAADRERIRARKRHLDFFIRGDMVALAGLLSPADAEVIAAALAPLALPRADPESPDGKDSRTAGQRRADALTELMRRALSGGQLPVHGGNRPQVSLTIDVGDLEDQAVSPATGTEFRGTGFSDAGRSVPAWEARLTCCDAEVTPSLIRVTADGENCWDLEPIDGETVDQELFGRLLRRIGSSLGGSTVEVLALGRTVRLVTPPLRRGLVLRDRGCAYPGCDRPPTWCEAHHLLHWADGGETELGNLALVCSHHHTLMHVRHLTLAPGAGGRWELAPYDPGIQKHSWSVPDRPDTDLVPV